MMSNSFSLLNDECAGCMKHLAPEGNPRETRIRWVNIRTIPEPQSRVMEVESHSQARNPNADKIRAKREGKMPDLACDLGRKIEACK